MVHVVRRDAKEKGTLVMERGHTQQVNEILQRPG